MKYIEEYLKDVIKIKPLGELTTKEDELDGMSGEIVYIDGKCSSIFISHADYANWLEKQSQQKQEEIDQKCEPFRIKKGEWYVCIHDFCNKAIRIGEIIQAEHDDTIRGIDFLYMENKYFRPAFENEIPQKPKWTGEDEEQCSLLIRQLATLKHTLALDFRNEIKWLKSLKQRLEE